MFRIMQYVVFCKNCVFSVLLYTNLRYVALQYLLCILYGMFSCFMFHARELDLNIQDENIIEKMKAEK